MFENLRRGRQARSFTTNVPKILDVKSSSEHDISPTWYGFCAGAILKKEGKSHY